MGSTWIRNGERGFWMRDSDLELWLRFLALHVDEPVHDYSTEAVIRQQWLRASGVGFTGCVPDDLERFVSTLEGEAVVKSAIASLMDALSQAPQTLDRNVLNLMGIPGTYLKDYETQRLIEIGSALLDLIDGKTPSTLQEPLYIPKL